MLEAALAAPGVRAPLSPEQRDRLARRGLEPSLHERASVFLLLADVLQRLWEQARPEAAAGQGQGPGQAARRLGEEAECTEARKVGGVWGSRG